MAPRDRSPEAWLVESSEQLGVSRVQIQSSFKSSEQNAQKFVLSASCRHHLNRSSALLVLRHSVAVLHFSGLCKSHTVCLVCVCVRVWFLCFIVEGVVSRYHKPRH